MIPSHPLTFSQAARIAGCSVDTIREAVEAGEIQQRIYLERAKRIPPEELEAWVNRSGLAVGDLKGGL